MRISDWSSDVCSSDLEALRAAAQNGGVAGLEAERAGIGGHVRPALVDDADDAQGHGDAGDLQAVRPLPLGHGAPDRIRQLGKTAETRVGTEGVRTRRTRCASFYYKKKTI